MAYVKLILEGVGQYDPLPGWNRNLKGAGGNRVNFKNFKTSKIYQYLIKNFYLWRSLFSCKVNVRSSKDQRRKRRCEMWCEVSEVSDVRSQKYQNSKIEERVKQKREKVFFKWKRRMCSSQLLLLAASLYWTFALDYFFFVVFFKNKCSSEPWKKIERIVFGRQLHIKSN